MNQWLEAKKRAREPWKSHVLKCLGNAKSCVEISRQSNDSATARITEFIKTFLLKCLPTSRKWDYGMSPCCKICKQSMLHTSTSCVIWWTFSLKLRHLDILTSFLFRQTNEQSWYSRNIPLNLKEYSMATRGMALPQVGAGRWSARTAARAPATAVSNAKNGSLAPAPAKATARLVQSDRQWA